MVPDEMSTGKNDLGMGTTEASPFSTTNDTTMSTMYQQEWLMAPDPELVRQEFMALGPGKNGTITGQSAKDKMVESKLPSNVLHKIWNLADIDRDGALTLYEYAFAMRFIKMRLEGHDIPVSLPPSMLQPPSAAKQEDQHVGPPVRSSPTNSHRSLLV